MSVRLIALDLDGTIFSDDLVISSRLSSALVTAQQARILVTIATGRMFTSARAIASRLGIAEPLICYQGAMVAHSATGEILYHKTLPLALAHEIIRSAEERGLHLNLYLNDRIFVRQITPEAQFYSKINMDMPVHAVGPLDQWLDTQGGAEPTKLVIVTDADLTDAVLDFYANLYGDQAQVTKSHARFTEFTNRDCSKGRALAFLADHYELDREEVMAIGDGHNDLDMIEWAGYGVAMSTSPEVVLRSANIVTGSLAEDGAAVAIEQYALEGREP